MKKGVKIALAAAAVVAVSAGAVVFFHFYRNSHVNSSYNPDKYVKLGRYKGLKGQSVDVAVSDAELTEEIDSRLSDESTSKAVTDRGAETGDEITFDYSVTVDGKNVEDCGETDYVITLGDGDLGSEVDEGLKGCKKGDTVKVDAVIPEDLSESNGGDQGTFTFKVTSVDQEIIPELDEKFAKDQGYDSVEEYKDSVREELITDYQSETESWTAENLLDQVVDDSSFDGYPKSLYDECAEEFDSSMQDAADMFGMDVKEYMENYSGYDDKSRKKEIVNYVNQHMVVEAIARAENMKVSDKEYSDYLKDSLSDSGYDSTDELENAMGKDTLNYYVLYDKVVNFLMDKADLTPITMEKYNSIVNAADSDTEE